MSGRLRGKILPPLLFGLIAIVVVDKLLVPDVRQLGATLRVFRWGLAPAILGLTLYNYALRFVKWQYYLRLLGVRDLRAADSALVFFGNFTMVLTPGKVGELFKSYLLRRVAGTPIAASAPIIIAERMTDGLAMVALAALGLTSARFGWPILVVTLAAALAAIVLVQHRPLAGRVLRAGERIGPLSSRVHHLHEFYESAYELLRPKPLGVAVLLGFASWLGECVAFFLVLLGLGLPASWALLVAATSILALATLVGSASMLPGGLGVADASIAGMLLAIVATPLMTHDVAVAASLLIRFATLWFGVLIGAGALALFHRRFGAVPDLAAGEPPAVDAPPPGAGEAPGDAATLAERAPVRLRR
ncbi:MAG TPA: lysylphosphatidylglycerol synthase transmembrane domain-containing protein [Thermomicrobiales bacterium]|nr:lysylphosphatidylglycerol synthase transmembrane domain-containing protein [Thermomicrobiales bacterium]